LAKIAAQAAADVVKYANALGLTPVGRQHLAPLAQVAASSRGCSAVMLDDQYVARISEAKSGADLSGQPAQAIHPHSLRSCGLLAGAMVRCTQAG